MSRNHLLESGRESLFGLGRLVPYDKSGAAYFKAHFGTP